MTFNKIFTMLCRATHPLAGKHNQNWFTKSAFHCDKNWLCTSADSFNEKDKRTLTGKVTKMLEMSAPLHPDKQYIWATKPYVEGTVYNNDSKPHRESRTIIDPKDTCIIVFPGQGNQFIGMGKKLLSYPVVQDMFSAAGEILGYNLLKLCLEGPAAELNRTVKCQIATYVCSLAAIEKLKAEHPEAINKCFATAGYSVGEIAALVFAGVISFEKGLRLIMIRAEAMEICAQEMPGGMMTLLCGADTELRAALKDAREHSLSKGTLYATCSTAVYLFPHCKVIAGDEESLNYIEQHTKHYKIRKTSRLPVSGAFHSNLMRPAAEPFLNALKNMDLKEPLISVYSNVLGSRYNNLDYIIKELPKQIYLPVKWEQICHQLYTRTQGTDFPTTYECGPGVSLKVILRFVNRLAAESCLNIPA